MRRIPLLLLPCCLLACDPAPNGTANADEAVNAGLTANEAATANAVGNAANGADAVIAGNQADPSPTPKPDAAAASSGGQVTSLPLTRGYYVDSGTPCGNASNATLMLVRRDGYGGSRYSCDFKKIERTGPTNYRVTEACSEGGEAWGTDETVETTILDWQIQDETHFARISESGDKMSARYCPQARLPEPWNTNDIRDVVQ